MKDKKKEPKVPGKKKRILAEKYNSSNKKRGGGEKDSRKFTGRKRGKKSGKKNFSSKKRFHQPSIKKIRQQAIEKIAEQYQITYDMAGQVFSKKISPERAKMLSELAIYKKIHYEYSRFNEAYEKKEKIVLFLHEHRQMVGRITKMKKYDFFFLPEGSEKEEELAKLSVKYIVTPTHLQTLSKLIKQDKKFAREKKELIVKKKERNHIKNKTLFPLMLKRVVVLLTTLDGDIIRGLIAGFSRYEIQINLKNGTPVIVLRHSVANITDKEKKESYIKKKLPQKSNAEKNQK